MSSRSKRFGSRVANNITELYTTSELYIISGVRPSVSFRMQKVKPKNGGVFTSSARPLTLFFSTRSVTSSEVRAERLVLDVKFHHFWLHFLYTKNN